MKNYLKNNHSHVTKYSLNLKKKVGKNDFIKNYLKIKPLYIYKPKNNTAKLRQKGEKGRTPIKTCHKTHNGPISAARKELEHPHPTRNHIQIRNPRANWLRRLLRRVQSQASLRQSHSGSQRNPRLPVCI